MPNKKTKYANQKTKYTNQKFTLLCREAIFVANLRTCFVYFLQAWKIWWSTKNDKYQVWGGGG